MRLNNSYFSIYGSHDSNVSIVTEDGEYFIYELEKINGVRHYSLEKDPNFYDTLLNLKRILDSEFNFDCKFSKCIYGQCSEKILTSVNEIFGCTDFEEIGHHIAHAAVSFYTSDFEESVIASYDAGGHDNGEVSTFNFYYANKNKGIEHIEKVDLNVCDPYTCLAIPLSCIHKKIEELPDNYEKNDLTITYQVSGSYLTMAGKIMGLSGYGKVVDEWIEFFNQYYNNPCDDRYRGQLGEDIGMDLKNINTIGWEKSLDIAACSQFVFNCLMNEKILPYVDKYKMPVCLSGGGAMNIIYNQYLRNSIDYPVHIPPNPGDCGLSLGFLLLKTNPKNKIECSLNGIDLVDRGELKNKIEEYSAEKCTIEYLADLINDGNIIGIVYGRGEVGERALLRRSIIASPSIPGIKNRINIIKNREEWRPIAPSILEEKTSEYFTSYTYSPYMSFNPMVKNEMQEKVREIVHIDGTARAQTLNCENNKFGYELVNAFYKKSGIPIIINTSFNNRGKSILSSISEALEILESTDIDYVWIEGYIFRKKNNN